MNVAKVLSSASTDLGFNDIKLSFQGKYADSYLKQVISASIQLKILEKVEKNYQVVSEFRDKIKQATKNELIFLFRKALQDFPPFLLYADFLSKGYSSDESANMIRGIIGIAASSKKVEKSLRIWGTESGLIIKKEGKYRIPEAEKGLPSNYVKNLLKALDSELTTKTFLIDTLSPKVYGCITTLGMNISDLAQALINYESDPKGSLSKASNFFETFLHKFGAHLQINLQGMNGVNALVNEFEKNQKILKNQKNIGNGLGGCRNISSHGVDSQTQKPWIVTPQASLSGMIMIPTVIKSYYLYAKESQQEL